MGGSERIRAAKRTALTSANINWFPMEVQSGAALRTLKGSCFFGESGSYRCVIEDSTVALPSIGMEIGDWKRHRRILVRRLPFPCSMRTMKVEVGPEIEQFVFKIRSRPEQRAIQILASYRTDPSFHKGMRQRSQVDGFDLGHLQDPQIGLPLPEPIKGIMAAAEVLRHPALPSKGPVEHPAKSGPIDGSGLNPKSNDAAAELIHNNQHPMGTQDSRFAPEQIQTPEAVLPVAQDC